MASSTGRWSPATYAYLTDQQRNLPGAFGGGPGTIASLANSGWRTLDAKGWRRPQGAGGLNQVSFGLREDTFTLDSPKYNTAD